MVLTMRLKLSEELKDRVIVSWDFLKLKAALYLNPSNFYTDDGFDRVIRD